MWLSVAAVYDKPGRCNEDSLRGTDIADCCQVVIIKSVKEPYLCVDDSGYIMYIVTRSLVFNDEEVISWT